MEEPRHILALFDRLAPGDEAVLATVVDVVGSGYRRPGARMLLTGAGDRCGGISGGCLEGDLARRCRELTVNGPCCEVYDTRGDIERPAGRYDTGCDGLVKVLVERVGPVRGQAHPISVMRRLLAGGPELAAATVYGVEGDCSQALIADRMVLTANGTCHSTLPEGPLAEAIRADLAEVMHRPRPISKQYRVEGGVVGVVEVLLEPLRPPRRLVVFGGGDDVRPLVSLAGCMGWRTTVVEKRPHLARPERFPGAEAVHCLPAPEGVRRASLTRQTAVVLMTHSLSEDVELLWLTLASEAGYIGLLGPRARVGRLMAQLHRMGGLPEVSTLERLHAPVGLDLGSAEPAGVALAILAEIEATFNSRSGGPLRLRTDPIHPPHERILAREGARP